MFQEVLITLKTPLFCCHKASRIRRKNICKIFFYRWDKHPNIHAIFRKHLTFSSFCCSDLQSGVHVGKLARNKIAGRIEADSGWQEDRGRSLISGQRMGNWADLPLAGRLVFVLSCKCNVGSQRALIYCSVVFFVLLCCVAKICTPWPVFCHIDVLY